MCVLVAHTVGQLVCCMYLYSLLVLNIRRLQTKQSHPCVDVWLDPAPFSHSDAECLNERVYGCGTQERPLLLNILVHAIILLGLGLKLKICIKLN